MVKHGPDKVIIMLLLFSLLTSCGGNQSAQTKQHTATPDVMGSELSETGILPTTIPFGPKISEIQGAAHRSPLEGQTVENVYGIVIGKRGDGFYLQDPAPDGDIATSEGIFVAVRGVPWESVGDAVLITRGTVREFNPAGIGANSLTITQIVVSDYEVLSHGNALPAPTIIGIGGRIAPTKVIDDDIIGYAGRHGSFDAEDDGLDFYESLESMLVQVNNAVAVSATTQYKEITILLDGGSMASILSPRGAIILRETDPNPERILLDDAFILMPAVRVGDIFTEPIIGILDYTFGNFKLQPTNKLVFKSAGLTAEITSLEPKLGEISVATYNVENLDAEDNPKRLEILARHIVENLKTPDLIGLQEVQDNDGELDSLNVSAEESFQEIIYAVLAAGGPEYEYLNIDPVRNKDGGAPGGNIRVGILYRSDRGLTFTGATPGDAVTPVEVVDINGQPSLSYNPGRISPESYAFFDSRKPLVAEFMINGEKLFVVVNHFNSKGGDGPLFGDMQPPGLESESQRVQQAKVLNAFVEQLLNFDPQASIIVMGDLNDFPWSAPILTLKGEELVNLMDELPVEEQYTYIYDGNAQVLDHILVSSALLNKLSAIDVVHINSEFYYQDRMSDHDPVLALFDMETDR